MMRDNFGIFLLCDVILFVCPPRRFLVFKAFRIKTEVLVAYSPVLEIQEGKHTFKNKKLLLLLEGGCKCQRKAKQEYKIDQNLSRRRRKPEMINARRKKLTDLKDKSLDKLR
jgi:hypothetical protein